MFAWIGLFLALFLVPILLHEETYPVKNYRVSFNLFPLFFFAMMGFIFGAILDHATGI